jgi:two-component system response regulator HydG
VTIAGKERILVVDDSPATVEVLERILAGRGHPVHAVATPAEALAALARERVDLVITDLKMPAGNGLELIRHVRERHPQTLVMMITGYASVEGAVEAMRSGAEEYLAKPFTVEELNAAVDRALAKVRCSRPDGASASATLGLAGRSAAMVRIRDQVLRASRSSNPVSILGEPGTGRQLVARAIHYSSPQAAGPFVVADCRRIPPGRFDREVLAEGGLLAAARNGTFFLAEVDRLDMGSQARLARALAENREARVMASGPTDLATRGLTGKFLPDLLARIEATRIDVPPLRERREDIEVLARLFLARGAATDGLAAAVDDGALRLLERHDWPGNVAELEALVTRCAGRGRLTSEQLPPWREPPAAGPMRTLAEWEVEHIRTVLESVGGNKTRAAAILGIDRKTLRQKLR